MMTKTEIELRDGEKRETEIERVKHNKQNISFQKKKKRKK